MTLLPEPSRAGPLTALILRPNRLKLAGLLLTSLVLSSPAFLVDEIAVEIAGGFFILCSVGFCVLLLPNAAYLRLEQAGFTYCSLFRKRFTAWSDVTAIGVTSAGGRQLVGFDCVSAAGRHPKLAALSASLSGYTGALPDTYGLRAAELAALMVEMQRRALAQRP